MSHRKPLHPLERWANDATSRVPGIDGTKSSLVMESSLADLVKRQEDPIVMAHELMQPLMQMTFAADCLDGRAQIVHIADGLYEDVCASKLSEGENEDRTDGNFPWPCFAIELNDCASQQALVVSSVGYMAKRAPDTERLLGVEAGAVCQLMSVMVQAFGTEHLTLAFIPSEKTCQRAARQMLRAVDENSVGMFGRDQILAAMAKVETMPYPLWLTSAGDEPGREEVVNLVMFVISDNVERRQTYAPPKGPRRTKSKRKRCEAHLYEMGVQWSDAYKAYREAVRSDPKGGHVRPHTRRGHFHRYRVGPRDGEVRYVTHWLPPTLVGDPSKYRPTNQGHRYG